jgi:hypothetical protein
MNNWRSISLHNFSHLMTLDWDFFMMMVVMMIMMIMMVVMMKVVLMDMFNRSSDLKGMTFSDSVMMRSDSVSKSNKIRSEMRINNEHILNQVISELRVLRSHPVKSFLDHSFIHGSMLIVIAFFRVEESSQSKESCSQREHISLVFVTLDLEVRVGDLLKPFRSNEGLDALNNGMSKTTGSFLRSKERIRELVNSVLAEDVEWSDISMRVSLTLEIRETIDKVFSNGQKFRFTVIGLFSLASVEVLLEIEIEKFDEDLDLVIGGAEVVLVFRGIAMDGDYIRVLKTDSLLEECEFSFISMSSVGGNFLKDKGLSRSFVTNNLDVTRVSIIEFGLDDFNVGVEDARSSSFVGRM